MCNFRWNLERCRTILRNLRSHILSHSPPLRAISSHTQTALISTGQAFIQLDHIWNILLGGFKVFSGYLPSINFVKLSVQKCCLYLPNLKWFEIHCSCTGNYKKTFWGAPLPQCFLIVSILGNTELHVAISCINLCHMLGCIAMIMIIIYCTVN